jgi:16S rRNA (guanine966-N2)-methyltransferase
MIRPKSRRSRRGTVRIIGGQWRGRRLPLPEGCDVRPTADRVRETLFNWLAPIIEGARCLDLFAGTGALGIEALSRHAGEVWFVERDPAAGRQLQASLDRLESSRDRVVIGDALQFLTGAPKLFDVVFLDPPFEASDLGKLCTLLERGWLAPEARIYLETGRRAALPELPAGWELLRERTAGQVRFALAKRG